MRQVFGEITVFSSFVGSWQPFGCRKEVECLTTVSVFLKPNTLKGRKWYDKNIVNFAVADSNRTSKQFLYVSPGMETGY